MEPKLEEEILTGKAAVNLRGGEEEVCKLSRLRARKHVKKDFYARKHAITEKQLLVYIIGESS